MSGGETQTSPFQLMTFFAFFAFAAVGVVMFALYQSGAGGANIGSVSVWGTIPENQFLVFISEPSIADGEVENIEYTYKDEETFNNELIEALASGYGPDLVLLSNDQILHHRDRVFATPYEQYDIRSFKETYVEAAEALLLPEGIIGFPVAVDPLVLYWNRTILANNQYVLPPKQWNELFKMSQKITRRGETGNINLSTIALGEFTNVRHAKDIFIAMLMQAGGTMTTTREDGTQIASLNARSVTATSPAQDALRFYTEFANPAKSTYTWSKAQPEARDAFVAGTLALYIGYASELPLILEKNPNLNFDVTHLPQLSNGIGERQSTMARVYAFSIPKVASNPEGAGILLNSFITKEAAVAMEQTTGLPSPRRDLIAIEPTDPLKTTFRNSAIMARSWRDPNPDATYAILAKMVEGVVSGSQRMSQSIERAQRELEVLIGNIY
jgi:ABC-type glycerol-3-phosphate transport system substrate-binding protein